MPQTNLFVFTNWLGSPSLMGQTVQTIFWAGGGVGGPDVIPNALTDGQKTWTGVYGADYRGKLPIANSVEDAELGGSKGSWTPLQLNNFAYDTLHANYVFWVWNTWQGNAAQRWSTGILPFLRTNPKIRTTCPTSYAWCFK
jgi:hypothetical protein